MARISFLPIFFASLATLFAGAVVVRVHHSSTSPAGRTAHLTMATPTAQTDAPHAAVLATDTSDDSAPAGTAAATLTVAEQTREQRYRELLGSPAPKTPPSAASLAAAPIKPAAQQTKPAQQPQPKQSMISKLVAPIVNAFTGGPSQASPLQPKPPQNQQDGNGSADPKDPSSDSTPPTLVSLVFQPPQIQDGQESQVVIMATDDLSGVRNISGSISSPNGKALQGFAAQPQSDGQHFIGRVVIPKDAESGMWRVNFVTMSDNASNTVNLHSNQLPPTAVLQVVSSSSDNTPPTLRSAWLDRRAVNAGEKDTLFVQADDDKSGVALVSGVFISPSKFARIGFGCTLRDDLSWQCDVPVPKLADCGDWTLEQIQMQDKAGNQAFFRADNPIVQAIKMNVGNGQCDNTPPQMTSIQLNPTVVSNATDSVIQVTITATDDLSGVRDISGQVMGPPQGGQKPYYFQLSKTAEPTTFVGTFTVRKLSAKGVWKVVWVSVTDNANNLKTYSTADPLLANAQFTVN